MFRTIILVTGLLFTSSVLADGFFIGANVGGNVTKSSPVGDLPMAREQYGIFAVKNADLPEYTRIFNDVISQGGTFTDSLTAAAHLNSVQLNFKLGINLNIDAGYVIKDLYLGMLWKYIRINYKSINVVGDGDDTEHLLWSVGNSSGYTLLNAFVGFGEYKIKQLQFNGFIPIAGAGIGFANVKNELTINSVTASRNQSVFAYQIKAGVNYSFTNNWHGNIETVFFGTSKIKATNTSLKQWQFINIGVRYLFN